MFSERSLSRVLVVGSLLLIFLISAAPSGFISASPPIAPSPPNWSGNFTISPTVPFVWLRTTPSSYAQVIVTLYPPSGFIATVNPSRDSVVWDGVQWWGYVSLPMSVTTGWVEVASLQRTGVISPTGTPQAGSHESWTSGTVVRVKNTIPYVWLRAAADSYAGSLLTVYLPGLLTVFNNNPVLDGRQWWWQVKHPGTGVVGWVEQSSLELASGVVVTEKPRPAVEGWVVGSQVVVKSSIPFSWLRSTFSSWATTNFTVISGQVLVLAAAPQYDGIQWWWQVLVPNTQISGWVEQNSIAPGSVANATSTAAPDEVITSQAQAAFQTFEHGFMIWRANDESVFVLINKTSGAYGRWIEYVKVDYASLPDNPVSDVPPSGLVKPVRGFGRVWGNFREVRDALGWATASEQAYTVTITNPVALLRYRIMSLPDGREIKLVQSTASAYWYYITP